MKDIIRNLVLATVFSLSNAHAGSFEQWCGELMNLPDQVKVGLDPTIDGKPFSSYSKELHANFQLILMKKCVVLFPSAQDQQRIARSIKFLDPTDRSVDDVMVAVNAPAKEHENDLKSGTVKPVNIEEAKIASSAEDGMFLASAPKVRPDNRSYVLVGSIFSAGNKPEFMAQHLEEFVNRYGHVVRRDVSYFFVKIPKSMQDRYYDTARVGASFRMIGRYTANSTYKTVDGQTKGMPSFNAVYFELN